MNQACLNPDCRFEACTSQVFFECPRCACALDTQYQDLSGSWDHMPYLTDAAALQENFKAMGYRLDSDFCVEIWDHHSRNVGATWMGGAEIENNARHALETFKAARGKDFDLMLAISGYTLNQRYLFLRENA